MHNILMAFPAHYNGYRVVSGVISPTLGNYSSSFPLSSPAWTVLQNASADDATVAVPLPFTWTFNGTGYTTVYFCSNLYITFGAGSGTFNVSSSSPALNKIMFNAGDRSYQRVAYLTSVTDYVRVRFEGGIGRSATPGASSVIFEATFFNPAKTRNLPTLEFLIGLNEAIGSGTSGIYSSSALLTGGTWTPSATTSYVLQGTLPNANAWNIYTNYYIVGPGY